MTIEYRQLSGIPTVTSAMSAHRRLFGEGVSHHFQAIGELARIEGKRRVTIAGVDLQRQLDDSERGSPGFVEIRGQ